MVRRYPSCKVKHFAGASVKRYPMSKVRETQVDSRYCERASEGRHAETIITEN